MRYALFEETSATSIAGSIEVKAGEILIACYVCRSQETVPDDYIVVFVKETGELDQKMGLMYKKITTDGTENVRLTQQTAARFFVNLIAVEGSEVVYEDGKYSTLFAEYPLNYSLVKDTDQQILWCLSCSYAMQSGDMGYTISPTDVTLIQQYGSTLNTQSRCVNVYDDGTGAVSHDITNTMTTSRNYLIDAVVIVNYKTKWLLEVDGIIYSFHDTELIDTGSTEATAELFEGYGSDVKPSSELLMGLASPKVLYWYDNEYKNQSMSASLTGAPAESQQVISNRIDLSKSSIKGIESVTVDCDGDIVFAVSMDGKKTWLMFLNEKWVELSEQFTGMTKDTIEAITAEQWNILYNQSQEMYIRCSIADTTQALRQVFISFLN